MKRKGARVLVSEGVLARAERPAKFPKSLLNRLETQWSAGGWMVLRLGDCPVEGFDFRGWLDTHVHSLGMHSIFAEIYLDNTYEPQLSPIGSRWWEYLGNSEIPFDRELRRAKLKSAFELLAIYIDAHEKIKASAPVVEKRSPGE
jgi:hypothetical protein